MKYDKVKEGIHSLGYKYIYADTNIVSDICKENGLISNFMKHFPINENNLFCFSTYTLYEISRNDTLMTSFQKFYSIFPCAITVSYFPLGLREIDFISGDTSSIDPILLSPQGIKVDGKSLNPNSLELLLGQSNVKEAMENIQKYTNLFYSEYSNLLEKEEFKQLKDKQFSRNEFIQAFKKYELKTRFFSGKSIDVDKNKLKMMKSLEVLAQGIYYKFYSDLRRKVSKSDIIDILIMTTAPYVHTFISENNNVDIYRKIIKMNQCGISNNCITISDLKK
ncbi:MAG: hypothetical protein J0G96_13485 [Flavobacteriia bacterium]|nr:hypothetical protein [Flavobacteriia bacterium]